MAAKAKTAEPTEQADQQPLRNRLYTEAQTELRKRHEDEFSEIITAKYAEHGLTYRRRLNDEEKAERDVRRLLSEHPGLAARFVEARSGEALTGDGAPSNEG